jgi:hypothetical protein
MENKELENIQNMGLQEARDFITEFENRMIERFGKNGHEIPIDHYFSKSV